MGEINYDEFTANFAVVGVGGCGSNQVNRIYNNGIRSAETIAVNTDAKHLSITNAHKKLLIGKDITRGMGAGGYPEVALKAAQSSASAIKEAIKGYDMVFITAGMGGGTGGGAAPVIAEMAKEQGSLVVAFVTYPFGLERSRKAKANWSIEQLTKNTDTTIIIENDRLLSYYSNLPMEKAFEVVDNITANAVRGITDTIKFPSLINLDFADVRSIMSNSGSAVINIGVGSGNDRIEHAIKSTISHPLMGYDIEGAKSALIHVSGGSNLTIKEATRLGEGVTESLGEKSNVIFGARLEPEANDKVYVMSIVTGVTPRLGEVKLYKEEKAQMDYNVESI